MNFAIKLNGEVVARVSGDNLCFGRKCRARDMMDSVMVEDRNLLKQVDAEGKSLWVLGLSHRDNITIEEEKPNEKTEARSDATEESTEAHGKAGHRPGS